MLEAAADRKSAIRRNSDGKATRVTSARAFGVTTSSELVPTPRGFGGGVDDNRVAASHRNSAPSPKRRRQRWRALHPTVSSALPVWHHPNADKSLTLHTALVNMEALGCGAQPRHGEVFRHGALY